MASEGEEPDTSMHDPCGGATAPLEDSTWVSYMFCTEGVEIASGFVVFFLESSGDPFFENQKNAAFVILTGSRGWMGVLSQWNGYSR